MRTFGGCLDLRNLVSLSLDEFSSFNDTALAEKIPSKDIIYNITIKFKYLK